MTTQHKPKYPHVCVRLVGEDGNAFAIIGRTRRALRLAGVREQQVEEFTRQATSGDYTHLLRTVLDWVTEGESE